MQIFLTFLNSQQPDIQTAFIIILTTSYYGITAAWMAQRLFTLSALFTAKVFSPVGVTDQAEKGRLIFGFFIKTSNLNLDANLYCMYMFLPPPRRL